MAKKSLIGCQKPVSWRCPLTRLWKQVIQNQPLFLGWLLGWFVFFFWFSFLHDVNRQTFNLVQIWLGFYLPVKNRTLNNAAFQETLGPSWLHCICICSTLAASSEQVPLQTAVKLKEESVCHCLQRHSTMFHWKISQLNEIWPMLLWCCSLSSFKGCGNVGRSLMTGKWQMSCLSWKKGKRKNLGNYKLISFISILGKTMKQVLMEDIFRYMENKKVFGTTSMGLPQTSCVQGTWIWWSDQWLSGWRESSVCCSPGLWKSFKHCLPWHPCIQIGAIWTR